MDYTVENDNLNILYKVHLERTGSNLFENKSPPHATIFRWNTKHVI